MRLPAAVALLEGFEAPAGAWETEILPARIAGYEPTWLDDHVPGRTCRLGTARAWFQPQQRACRDARCAHADHAAGAPARRVLDSLAGPANGARPSPRAQAVLDCLRTQGALFFDELAEASGLLAPASGGSTWRTRRPRGW